MARWQDNLRKVEPYVAGEQPQGKKVIKLNTNENPYPPAPGVEDVMKEFPVDMWKKYPDPDVRLLNEALAAYHGVTPDRIFSGVGSDDVLAMAFLTFFNSDKPILFPDITYAFYPVWAAVYQIPYETIPLQEDFTIRREDYYRPNGGIVLANPNAPTGIGERLDFIEDIVKHNPDVIVIVDEAYVDFGGESALPLLDTYDNLVVVRTFSKSRSMAGARIGYLVGSQEAVAALKAVKESVNSYTMNHLTIAMGAASVADDAYFQKGLQQVMATRERTVTTLEALGFAVLPSQTNFVFAKHKSVSGKEIFEKLRAQEIYVRYWNKPRIREYLRISIGTDEEMDALFEALRVILKEA